ncbi:LPXTG cell wall anchor domain-containing protein [Vagococcus zengguangii]|uniref:LPXTG cell wall anchor domain-containing protein n=1 Tax=Vagococcus zengguangii TaxID=2571750 RepID=A0A4D7CTD4_9ENTE|nr:LPXTG cell wall anchor domain-containing protein [Vagococcus zengguangii]QCI86324.1 LPXTG cell wall anchor domain-containing protein [Vagococcus zengguangii]
MKKVITMIMVVCSSLCFAIPRVNASSTNGATDVTIEIVKRGSMSGQTPIDKLNDKILQTGESTDIHLILLGLICVVSYFIIINWKKKGLSLYEK